MPEEVLDTSSRTSAGYARNPLLVALVAAALAAAGWFITDRIAAASRFSNNAERVQEIDRRLSEHLADAVSRRAYERDLKSIEVFEGQAMTRSEFDSWRQQMETRLAAIQADTRDIRHAIMGSRGANGAE